MDELKERNIPLFAISPQTPENSRELIERHGLKFEILQDAENRYASKLDLVHRFSYELIQVYRDLGIELEEANGESTWTLPIPARIIVNSDHRIVSIDANPDYRKRPEPSETLDKLP